MPQKYFDYNKCIHIVSELCIILFYSITSCLSHPAQFVWIYIYIKLYIAQAYIAHNFLT